MTMSRPAILLVLAVLLSWERLWAGGSGLNVIVVVNQNSTNSLQLGNDYCELRGVPPQNVLRMTGWTGGSTYWAPGDFTTNLLDPLLGMVNARGLTNQAQLVLLSMDIPFGITDSSNVNSTTSTVNSTTAALFYGFKTNTAPVAGYASCSLPDNTSNSYAFSELPFPLARPNTAVTNSFLAMMLTDTNLAGAESVLRRGVAADETYPTQAVYLEKTTDSGRNVRFIEFDNAVFQNQVVGNYAVSRLPGDSTAFTNLFGLMTGLGGLSLPTNTFVPGALGDSLTSYAGVILGPNGQTPLLAFLEAGAAGSYGTVVEPCNYTNKFPDPIDYFYQTRGFSLAESYYQSVLNPFEGLLVGEPLAAPFAQPGGASWSSLTNGTSLSGLTNLSLAFTAASTNLPLGQVDLFVDGVFSETLTNLPPVAGNILSVTLNGYLIHYTVPANATLASTAAGLAGVLNGQSGLTQVLALPFGDRIELQSLAESVPGSNVTVSVSSAQGTAASLTTHLTAARATFLDTVATGFQVVAIGNVPVVGDFIALTFEKTNGTMVTVGVTNTMSGTSIGGMSQTLFNLINANPALQSADGLSAADFYDAGAAAEFILYARSPGWPAGQLLATLTTSTDLVTMPTGTNPLEDNVSDLRPRNHLYVSAGLSPLPVNFTWGTTAWPDGWHQLTAVAYEGTSVATQTRVVRTVQVQNTGLTATLTSQPGGTNVSFGAPLQFTVTAIPTNIASIELFSTGGSLAVATNQAAATFVVSTSYLGLGWHPFHALVTDVAGHRYQTLTTSYRIIPPITLTLSGAPPVLAWAAIVGRKYDLQSATNLTAAFQTVETITASNSIIQWPVMTTGGAEFYRVQLDP